MADDSNVQQTLETGKHQVGDMHSKGNAEQRRAWALNAVRARWAKQRAKPLNEQPISTKVDGMTIEQLGADMPMRDAEKLTPAQKKIRTKLRKAKWWRERYQAEKAGLLPATTVTGGKPVRSFLPTRIDKSSAAYKRQQAREYYLQNRDRIRDRQKAYEKKVRMERNGEAEVATQPVAATPALPPSVANAVQIKVHVCGVCGARHYAVKE